MTTPAQVPKNKFRDAIFPIYGREEIVKFLLLGCMKFFIIFVLTLTRDTKDTLVVTQCGAEAIAFLKVYGVLPAATAFIATFAKLSSLLSRQALFYATSIPFFLFFLAFDLIVYPNRHVLEPSLASVETYLMKEPVLVDGGGGGQEVVSKIIAHWTSALFFVVAEVYSSVSIGILFWKFANDVVSMAQAKRFYPLFAYLSSFGPMIAGQYVVRYASKASDFASSLRRLTVAITISGIMVCVLHHTVNVFVERTEPKMAPSSSAAVHDEENAHSQSEKKKKKKQKPKLTMMESIKFLSSSEYLGLVTVLVLGYGIMYNFLEISWKSLVKRQYPDPLDYQRFMGNFSSVVGAATLVVIFLGSNIIKAFGWRTGAMATPVVMSVVAVPFFACTVVLGVADPSILHAAVMVGTAMILLSRAFKYGLFDPTTQMAYIPLDEESKVKGKAAIDVLGSRIGKSGASLIQQGLVVLFGNIIRAAPAVMVIFYAVSFGWVMAASRLSVLYAAKAEEEQTTKTE